MINKKEPSNIWIAAGHFAKAGILFPLIFIGGIGYLLIFFTQYNNQRIVSIIIASLMIIGVGVGTFFSAKNILKRYPVRDMGVIINWSILFFLIFIIVERGFNLLKSGNIDSIYLISEFIGLFLFYYLSCKYLKVKNS